MTKSQTLAKMAPGQRDPIAKLVDPPKEPPFQAAKTVDDHDLHVGIVRHLALDFSLGSALEQIAEARRLTGTERRTKIERAVRYLNEELAHC